MVNSALGSTRPSSLRAEAEAQRECSRMNACPAFDAAETRGAFRGVIGPLSFVLLAKRDAPSSPLRLDPDLGRSALRASCRLR
jgi:hypothetical protein